MSGNQAILGSTAKNVSKNSAIAIDTMAQRYGWAKALSTAPKGAEWMPKLSPNS
jgi:hypothetical protein